jgi:hypothetical protein
MEIIILHRKGIIWEQNAEENIRNWEGESGGRLEKTA